ncbi:MAG: YitT family protein [Oscillospiraceae bacterium]|nr:YitT family protein [Oscillospiraceae bacterium]
MFKLKDNKKIEILIDILMFSFGTLLFAISTNVFIVPNNLAPGGLIGLATILKIVFGLPVGWTTLAMNVPLFVLAYKKIGYSFLTKSLFCVILGNVLIEITRPFILDFELEYKSDILLASVFGGFIGGVGLAIIFIRGGSTGGIDIIANLLSAHNSHISIGKLLLILDALVIAISAFVCDIEKAFYASVCVFITTKFIDAIMYGVDIGTGKLVFVISSKNQEISQKIIKKLSRGVTELKSKGSYTGNEGEILLCAVRRHEIHELRNIVHSVDKNAFMVVTDAREITGEGFKEISIKTTI